MTQSAPMTKSQIVREIAGLLGIRPPQLSTGSTEPKAIFIAINDRLGLSIPTVLSKAEMGRAIVEFSGHKWLPDFESRGGTVTRAGLLAVLGAVEHFLRD